MPAGAQPPLGGLSGDMEMLRGAVRCLNINGVDFIGVACVVGQWVSSLVGLGGEAWLD